jgi:DNA-binding NarL/FixJ family response regulator
MSFPKKEITIAIVDDHPIVIEGLQKILASDFNVNDIKEFTSGNDFIHYLKENKAAIDIVLLDITLPDKSGIEICKEVKTLSPSTRVLAFSNHNERSIIMQMLHNGASGYLLKNSSSAELIVCINEALDGQITFSKEVKKIIAQPSLNELKTIPPLTKREKEILRMIADGKTSIEIADELFVSPLTIETHRRNLMQKFDMKNVAALIKIATQQQLI